MQAIEFISQAHDGVVDLPNKYQSWNGKKVHVILLETENGLRKKPAFSAIAISTRNYHFNRDAANER